MASLAADGGLSSSDLLNYHFVISNGSFDGQQDLSLDGLIEPTARWQSQFPCTEEGSWQKIDSIRVCIIGKGKDDVSEKQTQSILNLYKGLTTNYDIPLDRVDYNLNID